MTTQATLTANYRNQTAVAGKVRQIMPMLNPQSVAVGFRLHRDGVILVVGQVVVQRIRAIASHSTPITRRNAQNAEPLAMALIATHRTVTAMSADALPPIKKTIKKITTWLKASVKPLAKICRALLLMTRT